MKASLIAFLILAPFMMSCGSNSSSRAQTLGKPKVLALVADKPEVQPGTSVTISPLVSFVDIGSLSLTQEAWGCNDPGLSVGAVPTCDFASDRAELMSSRSLSLSGPNYTESLSSLFSFTVPSGALAAYDSISRYNGVDYIVEYILTISDGRKVRAIKRISMTDKALAEWNSNPSLTNIMKTDGTALSSLPTAKTGLFPNFPGTAKQAYTVKTSAGLLQTSTESLTVAWFVSRGNYSYDTTDSTSTNYYSPDGAGPTGTVTVVVILRDNRGGLATSIINM